MNWIERIITKYKIEKNAKILVFDKKGILSSSFFLEYLKSNNIKYRFAEALSRLSSIAHSDFTGIIFSGINTIPETIKNKFTNITINSYSLPFDISEKVYNLISAERYIQLADWITESDFSSKININNYKELLFKAIKREYGIERKLIIKEINQSLENQFDYNALLIVGEKLGSIEYNDYKFKIKSFVLPENLKVNVRKYILSEQFKNVFYELPEPPKTVDKIIPFIKSKPEPKVALICFDCMGFAEWNLLKEYLSEFSFIEHHTFALIPTITSISRKAIFSASHTNIYLKNETENKLFKGNFPNEHNVCFLPSSASITEDSILGYTTIGKIYNMFDDIAHSFIFPKKEKFKDRYFDLILSYLKSSSLKEDIQLLKDNEFKIYFCSDHGNIFAIGNGTKIDKWLVENSAKRAYIADQSSLLSDISFDKYTIPFVEDKIAIMADEDEMFNHKKSRGLVHGGISLPELVVPFIEVK
ncbi:MAG: PglZ domain-containing protein [Candidatus Tenebribacter mawsonii]|nr:PglZ domain-containing protein [Candidatus Tenebribacter mawsonii]